MGIRTYRPTSPARRAGQCSDWAELTRRTPEKSLCEHIKKTGGRNHHGLVTARHRGGGHPKRYRLIDFKRRKDGVPATVKHVEYDPNRSAWILLLHYADGEKRYIIAPKELLPGAVILSGDKIEPTVGNAMPLRSIPTGLDIHNVELIPGRGGQLARAAGTHAQLMAKEGAYATVLLPSGEIRKVHVECRATVGQVSNVEHNNISVGKAGRNRWRGWRPYVRGSCMNPVDHPMGGGEGRRAGGRHPCSPNRVPSKGGKSRCPRARSNDFIVRRRKRRGKKR